MKSAKEVKRILEEINKEWPKGGLYAVTMLSLMLLFDIRELLKKLVAKK